MNSVDEFRRFARKGESTDVKRSRLTPSNTRVKFENQQKRQADVQTKSARIETERARKVRQKASVKKGNLASHPAVHAAKGILSRFKKEKTSAYNQLFQYDNQVPSMTRLDLLTKLQNWDSTTPLLVHLLTDPVMNNGGKKLNNYYPKFG